MFTYGFSKTIDDTIDVVEKKVIAALNNKEFEVLSRTDLQEKFKKKLDVDFHKYLIFEAYNPPSLYKAILVEDNIGLMLPVKVILYEKNNQTTISFIKPTISMAMIDNPKLKDVIISIENKLKTIFDLI